LFALYQEKSINLKEFTDVVQYIDHEWALDCLEHKGKPIKRDWTKRFMPKRIIKFKAREFTERRY
jgi:hypothetical protein